MLRNEKLLSGEESREQRREGYLMSNFPNHVLSFIITHAAKKKTKDAKGFIPYNQGSNSFIIKLSHVHFFISPLRAMASVRVNGMTM